MRPQSYLLLGLTTLSLAATGLAWHQYTELVALRAGAERAGDREALAARLAALTRENRALQDQLAALHDRTDHDASAEAKTAASEAAAAALVAGTATLRDNLADESRKDAALDLLATLSDLPEFQKLVALQQRGAIDHKYAALFRRLHLAPEQQQQLESLLANKQTAFSDALLAAHDQGLSGKEARIAAKTVARATEKDLDQSIKSLLGDQGYQQYQNYERTMPQRETVNQLAQRLSYTAAPLSPRQQDQLVQALATGARQDVVAAKAQAAATGQKSAHPPTTLNALPNGANALGLTSSSGGVITSTAVAKAEGFLTAEQLATLQQMQQEQQAQLKLGKLLRPGKAVPAPAPVAAPAGNGKG